MIEAIKDGGMWKALCCGNETRYFTAYELWSVARWEQEVEDGNFEDYDIIQYI